jgi:hypothetical protein
VEGCVAAVVVVVVDGLILILIFWGVNVFVGEQMGYVEGGGTGDDDAGDFLDCAAACRCMCDNTYAE